MDGQLQLNLESDRRDVARERALHILRVAHRGRAQAITIQELADRCAVDRRTMHTLIAELVADGFPVGTISTAPHGCFYIEDEADLAAATANLLPRALKILKRYWRLRRISLTELFNQLKMELEP
jgi:DNA-binding MarR family transcriptional regulator